MTGWLFAVMAAFGFGVALGAAFWRRPRIHHMPDPEAERDLALATWRPRLTPESYLRQHPDGPYAKQARVIVGERSRARSTRQPQTNHSGE